MKSKEESNTANHTPLWKTIAMMFLDENRPKGEVKFKRARLSIEKAVHNGYGAAPTPRYTKQQNERARLRIKKAVCNQMVVMLLQDAGSSRQICTWSVTKERKGKILGKNFQKSI